jgi:hypothetical protein
MKVVIFYGSSKKFTFILMKQDLFNKSKFEYELFHFEDFVIKLHILCLCFVTFVVLI